MLDVQKIRLDFPVLQQKVYNKPLVYLDNAATTQKPKKVIDSLVDFYSNYNSNIHRGSHFLSDKATTEYENSRKKIADYIGAKNQNEIIFTSGTTASINTIAFSYGEKFIHENDEIILSQMEHNANIIPWQLLAERKNAVLKIIPVNQNGELQLDEFKKLISEKTKIVAITHVSNTMGTINPVEEIISISHKHEIPVLIDGAQSVPHLQIDVAKMDCDFFVFSGHKIYAPTGIGILYGKEKWLEAIPPYQGGGNMIDTVSFTKTTYNTIPHKFEAGTTNIASAISLGAAIDYLNEIGFENIMEYEHQLFDYSKQKFNEVEGIRIFGKASMKIPVYSFLINNIHHYDTGMVFDKMGIAVRTGKHCNQPLMEFFGILGTVRASFTFYNTFDEVDVLIEAIKKTRILFE